MNPKYPIYIVSKSRWDSRYTSKALEEMNVPYYIVVEKEQYDNYAAVIDPKKILILDPKYLDEYDTFDDLGSTKSKGPGAARNFAWDHSISIGATSHWVMDDNIYSFMRTHNNQRLIVGDGTILKCAEDFVDRYENIAISGLNYKMFCVPTPDLPPFSLNTRIYSCLLIRNHIPFRWRGRYNEDTDLSLRALKAGWCTLQFYAFLCDKATTQVVKGGNTEEFYKHEGTKNKSAMLEKMHPDVAKCVYKYRRDHHYVNYLPFKKNKLIPKKDLNLLNKINNYGMVLKTFEDIKKRNERYK